MMDKKYFFFDIDRTLGLDISQVIPADTVYCLRRLQQEGHFIAIATGRLQCDGWRTAHRYGIPSMVSDGGNSLTLDGKVIEMEGLPMENCRALLHELERRHLLGHLPGQHTPPVHALRRIPPPGPGQSLYDGRTAHRHRPGATDLQAGPRAACPW